ncbi:MAG: TonB-dependent receptor [Steroidobacteraceae bacterium]
MSARSVRYTVARALCAAALYPMLATPVALADPAPAQSAEAPSPLQEVVVTAQKFGESLEQTPLAIQVVSAAALERRGVTQAADLSTVLPGVQIGSGGGAAQIYIRGVGDFAASALSNPAVAVNVDGVYVSPPQAVNSAFYDLARIEVLKGPQGTLYGRNASGGALNLITNAPSLAGVDGYLTAELGSYRLGRVEGALNVPLGATVAVRGAFNVIDRAGYLSDGTDDDKTRAGRVRLLWRPDGDLSLLINTDFARELGRGPGYVQLPRLPGTDPWLAASSPADNARLAATPPIGFLVAPVGTDSYRDNTFWNVSAQLNWSLGAVDLTVLPAYRHADIGERNYPAGLRNTIPKETNNQKSLEARLSHSSTGLRWVFGLYYYQDAIRAEQQIFQGFLQNNDGEYLPTTKSYAAFGEATISLTQRLRLIAGARYTQEQQSVSGSLTTDTPNGLPPGTPLPHLLESFGGERTFRNSTWKGGFEYDLSRDKLLFATASTGFKAGGFNQTVAPLNTYEPEKLLAYEVGSRNRLLDGRLELNFELFRWNYRDEQIAHVIFDPLGNINLVTQNAGKATLQGGSIEMRAAPTADDRVRAYVEYNSASYDRFTYDTAYSVFGTPLFNPASTACPVGAPFPGTSFGAQLIAVNCSGFELPRAPKWTASLDYEHTFHLPGGATLTPAASAEYASGRWLGFEFVQSERAPSYTVYDFDLQFATASERWVFDTFVHNIANETAYSGGGEQSFAPPLVYATIGAPRTYGVRATYSLR